jgi:hypothetical protein
MKLIIVSILLLLCSVSAAPSGAPGPLPVDAKINVDFPNESRRAIVRNVADLFGLNLVLPEDFPDDKTSIKLRQVNWREIFDATFTACGYIYVVRSNLVLVMPRSDPREEIFALRDATQEAIDENLKLREAMKRLLGSDLTHETRGAISRLLADPHQCGDELLKVLPKKRPNQSPEPTAMSVTPPAAQESRQP